MRKGFDGLSALVLQAGFELYCGHLFVFVSRRADRAKILTFDSGGLICWYKRLEAGTFRVPSRGGEQAIVALDSSELALLLAGVDYQRARRSKRWKPPRAA